MKFKNKIAVTLCAAVTAVSFLHPIFGAAVYAEESETAEELLENTDVESEAERAEKSEEEQIKKGQLEEKQSEEERPEKEKDDKGPEESDKPEDTKNPEGEEEPAEQESGETEKEQTSQKEPEMSETESYPKEAEESEEEKVVLEGAEESEEEGREREGEDIALKEGEVSEMEEPGEAEEPQMFEMQLPEGTAAHQKVTIQYFPAARSAVTRANSIGISGSNPHDGQQNRYEYGGAQTFTVPCDGYYDVYCYGSEGGSTYESNNSGKDRVGSVSCVNGGKGSMRAGRAFLKKGTVLSVTAAGKGGTKTFVETEDFCKDHDVNWSGGVGNAGGPSYVRCGGTTIISASGGSAGYMDVYDHPCNGNFRMSGSGNAGSMQLANTGDAVVWQKGELDTSSYKTNSGNGYVVIKIARLMPSVTVHTADEWTNGKVTLTAEDIGEGASLPEKFLSWECDENGDAVWTDETSYVVSQNGTYTCNIRNTAGDITSASCEVNRIDRLAPKADLSASPKEWTAEDVTLTVEAHDREETSEDGCSGLHQETYLWGFVSADGETEWEMQEGTREDDKNGDDENDGNADNDVTETGDGEDDNTETDKKQPIDTEEKQPAQVEKWTDQSVYKASRNGVYRCKIRDNAGNITEVTCVVKNIDRTPPKVTCEKLEKWYDGGTRITIKAEDIQPDGTAGIGLDEAAYSTDGIHFSSRPELWIDEEGAYMIWVKDKLGNVKKAEFTFFRDKREPVNKEENREDEVGDKNGEEDNSGGNDTGSEDDTGGRGGKSGKGGVATVIFNAVEEPEPLPEFEPVREDSGHTADGGGVIIQKESVKKEKTPAVAEEIPLLESLPEDTDETIQSEEEEKSIPAAFEQKEEAQPEVLEQDVPRERKINWKKAVLYSVWMAAVLCGLVWLLFCLILEHVTVWRKEENGKYYKVGRCAIIRKKDYKQINLTSVMEKGEEADYKVRFSAMFVLLYKNDKVLLRTYHGVELRNVEKEIEILACNS